METLKHAAGLDIAHIHIRGPDRAQADLLGGRIQFLFDGLPAAAARMKSGDVRVLAVYGNNRHGIAPDLPTVAEIGRTGPGEFRRTGMDRSLCPGRHAGSDPRHYQPRVPEEFVSALDKLVFEQCMLSFALDPAQFAAFVRADSNKWHIVIKEAKIEFLEGSYAVAWFAIGA